MLQWLAGCIGSEADMSERGSARLWVSIVAAVLIFPTAVVLLLAAWAIHVQIAVPILTDPSPVRLAAAPAMSPVQEKVEAAASAQRATVTEPVAPPPKAPEPSSTLPTLAEASPADAGRAQGALSSASPKMVAKSGAPEPAEPVAGAVSPTPAQVEAAVPPSPATAAEPVAPAPDAKPHEFASASSLFATLAVVPPILGRASPAYADPTQDTFSSAPPVIAAKRATPELSESISGPIPLPKPKPLVTVAHVGRAVPLPRPRPELTR
jgi:hypothetical protein